MALVRSCFGVVGFDGRLAHPAFITIVSSFCLQRLVTFVFSLANNQSYEGMLQTQKTSHTEKGETLP